MSGNTAVAITSKNKNDTSKGKNKEIRETLDSRQSKDLVLAFCGAIGSRVNEDIIPEFQSLLESKDYKCELIKLSDLIKKVSQKKYPDEYSKISKDPPELERYSTLQDLGNKIRDEYGDDSLAQLCITEIAAKRKLKKYSDADKVVYLISQIKHPDEIKLLKLVYGNIFYLVGTLCSEEQRQHNLINKQHINEADAGTLIARDRNESNTHGQKLEKVLHSSDFFINSDSKSLRDKTKTIDRFIGLTHGENGITPTRHETGMYSAHIASLRSACLSRQVGAAIVNSEGLVIATGCNDVPKFGGGLYNADSPQDNRCVHYEDRQCFNDYHKSLLTKDISTKLLSALQSEANHLIKNSNLKSTPPEILKSALDSYILQVTEKTAKEIASQTQVKDLIEYSRAIHAEMDAIISLARQSAETTHNTSLYTTTYPCHNCARHIVTAGIKKVYYIEPYEKSLASKLHFDSISKNKDSSEKVSFLPFEGVSPKRYFDFFKAQNDRKDDKGKAVLIRSTDLNHVMPEYLDSYKDRETKVVEHIVGKISLDS